MAGTVKYLYDKNGNLRFIQDANQAAAANGGDFSTQSLSGTFTITGPGLFYWDIDGGSGNRLQVVRNNGPVLIDTTFNYICLNFDGTPIPGGDYTYSVSGNISICALDAKVFKFSYLKYDALNRITENGEYLGSSGTLTSTNADNTSFPSASSDKLPLVKNFYDDVATDCPEDQSNLKGRLSRTQYYDEHSNSWGNTWYSYTAEGWLEWLIQDIPGMHDTKKIAYEYDLQGNITKVSYDADGKDFYYQWNDYNALGQLTSVKSSYYDYKNNADLEATYTYWPDGQVKQLVYGQGGNNKTMDYQYTVRGWLDNINAPGDIYDGATHRFAERLYYGSDPSNLYDFTPRYNGDIAAAEYFTEKDGSSGSDPTSSYYHRYNFSYDNLSRLTDASFYYDPGNGWTPSAQYYNYAFGLQNVIYDAMGNITSLTRKNQSGSGSARTYHYESGTNKLDYVSNLNSQSSGNYAYDANGNLTKDVSKNISTNDIIYNSANLPTKINFSTGEETLYSYDGAGNRIMKKHDPGTGDPSGTYYVYDALGRTLAVYDLNGTLKFINIYGLDLIGKAY